MYAKTSSNVLKGTRMIKDTAVQILLDHFSEGMVRTIVDAIAEDEREECAKLCDYVYNNIVTDEHIKNMAFKIRARGQE